MKKLIWTVVVVGGLVLGGRYAIEEITEASRVDSATQRVNLVMAGMVPGVPADEYELAVSMFWAGAVSLNSGEEFIMAASVYDRWKKSLGEIDTFAVRGGELEDGGASVLVTVDVPRGSVPLRVTRGKPIERVD